MGICLLTARGDEMQSFILYLEAVAETVIDRFVQDSKVK